MSSSSSQDQAPPVETNRGGKALASLKKTMEDQEKVEQIRKDSKAAVWYDFSSPSVRSRRATARRMYEEFVKIREDKPDMTSKEIWKAKTIIKYSCELIPTIAANLNTGTMSKNKKPKAGVLYDQKQGMYWWAIRFIPDFGSIFLRWHTTMNSMIHKAALDNQFETGSREKNELTDAELTLFWHQLQKIKHGVDNWKQHYLAWLLVYYTSVRPGSFTVCPGYEKGAIIGAGHVRQIDETLRWKDVLFFRHQGTVGFKITFRFVKGHRDPYKAKTIDAKRTFTIYTVNSDHYSLDLAMVMVSVAFSRGVFKCASIEELYQDSDKLWIPRNNDLDEIPVFLKADNAGQLTDEAMHENSLNPKLQEMCSRIGLYARNSMYSLRRAAIIDTRRKEGTEVAQELATHQMQGSAVYAYDHLVLEDFDLANVRSGTEATARAEMRRMFSQANIQRYSADTDVASIFVGSSDDMQNSLNKEAAHLAYQDLEYVQKDDAVRAAFAAGKGVVLGQGIAEFNVQNDTDLKDQLGDLVDSVPAAKGALDTFNCAISDRNNALRRAKKEALKEVKAKRLVDAKADAKVMERQSKRNEASVGQVGVAEMVQMGGNSDANQLADSRRRYMDAIEDLDDGETAAENMGDGLTPQERVEEEQDHGRSAPADWRQDDDKNEDEVEIRPRAEDGDAQPTQIGRINFHKTFIGVVSLQNTDLYCIQCKLDPTVGYQKKQTTYTYSLLQKHLKSGYHTRDKQVGRAFTIDKNANNKCKCPVCPDNLAAKWYGEKEFTDHMRLDHVQVMDI